MSADRPRARTALLLVVALLAGGAVFAGGARADEPATTPDPSITDGSAAKALAAARHRWHVRGHADYRFTIARSCFCAPESLGPLKITVRRRVPVAPPESAYGLTTARSLFDLVAQAIANPDHVLQVTYDRRTGFPLRIQRDPIQFAVDDELTLTMTAPRKLRPIRP